MALPTPSDSTTALVTGASSGIGVEIARLLAARGHGVTLVARRESRLRELADELSGALGIRAEVIAADLTEQSGRDAISARLEELGLTPTVLVNNAGFGGHGELVETDPGWDVAMVRLNVEAVTDLLRTYVPTMVERGEGAVINIASTAAFQPMPGNATYAATKSFVLSQSEALAHEVKGAGVSVTAVCPGPVRTEFVEVAGVEDRAADAPDIVWTEADEVARAAVDGVEAGKRVVIPGRFNQVGAYAARFTPRALLLPAVDRIWNR